MPSMPPPAITEREMLPRYDSWQHNRKGQRARPKDLPVASGSSSFAGHEVYESQENDGADRGADDFADDA